MYKILSTRTLDKGLVRYAEAKGLDIHCIDFIEIKDVTFDLNILNEPFDAVIFTSANAVSSFFRNPKALLLMEGKKILCTAGRTKDELEKRGVKIAAAAENAERLSAVIIERKDLKNVLHVCGNLKLETLEKNLAVQNIRYTSLEVYHTELLHNIEVQEKYDGIMFYSPSAVEAFLTSNQLMGCRTYCCIGETTANALLGKNNELKILLPEHFSVESMINRLSEYFKENNN